MTTPRFASAFGEGGPVPVALPSGMAVRYTPPKADDEPPSKRLFPPLGRLRFPLIRVKPLDCFLPPTSRAQRNTTNYNSVTIGASTLAAMDDFPPGRSGLTSRCCWCWRSTGSTARSLVYLYYRNRQSKPRPRGPRSPSCRRSPCSCRCSTRCTWSSGCSTRWPRIRYPRDRFQIQVLDDSHRRDPGDLPAQDRGAARATPSSTSSTSTAPTAPASRRARSTNGLRDRQGRVRPDLRRRLPAAARHPRAHDRTTSPIPRSPWCSAAGSTSTATTRALTEVQALMLDGHFVMEHAGRNRSGRFFNFNGTAGIWRRAAIADAGGWQHDTLTEDMDLSYRAQLRGWKFVYLPDIVVARRAARGDVGVQVAAVPLGQGLGAGGQEAAADDPALERDLRARSRRRSSTSPTTSPTRCCWCCRCCCCRTWRCARTTAGARCC